LLKQLKKGFEALTLSKTLSDEFAEDAKGKRKTTIRAATAAAADYESLGVGAFARGSVGAGAVGGQQQQAWQESPPHSNVSGFSSAVRPSSSAQVDVALSALRLYGSSAPTSHGSSKAASALGSPALAASPAAAQAKHPLPFADLDATAAAASTAATRSLLTQLTVQHDRVGLSLDMRAHADPAAQLSDVGMASHGGEVARIYTSGGIGGDDSSSALPWWSSAATAIPPVGVTSDAASFADAAYVDRHAESRVLDGGRGAQRAPPRYQPKPPAAAKRA